MERTKKRMMIIMTTITTIETKRLCHLRHRPTTMATRTTNISMLMMTTNFQLPSTILLLLQIISLRLLIRNLRSIPCVALKKSWMNLNGMRNKLEERLKRSWTYNGDNSSTTTSNKSHHRSNNNNLLFIHCLHPIRHHPTSSSSR